MENRNRGKAGNKVDAALADSFPASDPPAWNMGRDKPRTTPATAQAATSTIRPKRPPQRTRSSAAKSRVARADQRKQVKADERQIEGRAMPKGRLMLSPVAWLRWLLRRTVRPAERQF